jgi:hypothetical protein
MLGGCTIIPVMLLQHILHVHRAAVWQLLLCRQATLRCGVLLLL